LLFEENRLLATGAKQDTIRIRATEKKCYKRSNTNHLAKTCKNKDNIQETRCFKCRGCITKFCKKEDISGNIVKCDICKKNNHSEKDCYFRKNKLDDQSNTKDKISFLVSSCKTDEWILDSGSTTYIINNKNLFKEMKKSESQRNHKS